MKVLLSRTDNIGDVIFTLPMAGLIKKYYPQSKVYFLGKSYTRAIVECCSFIDGFYTFEEIQQEQFKEQFDVIVHVFPNKEVAYLAKKQKIKMRIGTSRRFFHWLTCNRLVNLTRKNSHRHEAQLNLKLLHPLHIQTKISLEEIPDYYGFTQLPISPTLSSPGLTGGAIDKNKFNLIIHPKSKGSAREWSAKHYVELCNSLPKDKFNIFVSGTKEEEKEIQEKILSHCPQVKSVVGLFSLEEFIAFIAQCDGLIACSTGPLHIAAALGKHVLGLYPPIKNMLPTRWGALGKRAKNLVGERDINSIKPKEVLFIISGWEK